MTSPIVCYADIVIPWQQSQQRFSRFGASAILVYMFDPVASTHPLDIDVHTHFSWYNYREEYASFFSESMCPIIRHPNMLWNRSRPFLGISRTLASFWLTSCQLHHFIRQKTRPLSQNQPRFPGFLYLSWPRCRSVDEGYNWKPLSHNADTSGIFGRHDSRFQVVKTTESMDGVGDFGTRINEEIVRAGPSDVESFEWCYYGSRNVRWIVLSVSFTLSWILSRLLWKCTCTIRRVGSLLCRVLMKFDKIPGSLNVAF